MTWSPQEDGDGLVMEENGGSENYAKCTSAGARLLSKLQNDISGVLFLSYEPVGTKRIK